MRVKLQGYIPSVLLLANTHVLVIYVPDYKYNFIFSYLASVCLTAPTSNCALSIS